MEDDVKRIEYWARVFANPESLAMILMANTWGKHEALMENVREIDADSQKKDYRGMGKVTADLLTDALGPVQALSEYTGDSVFPDLDNDHQHC